MAKFIVYQSALKTGRRAQDVHLRFHREDDLEKIAGHYVDLKYIRQRLNAGTQIVVAEVDGHVAGWRFFSTPPCLQSPCFIFHAPEDVVFGFAAFVLPAFRGRRLFSALTDFASAHFLDAGQKRLVSLTEFSNLAARSAHLNTGEEPVLEITSYCLLNFRCIQLRGRTHFGYWDRRRRFPVRLD